MPSGPFVKQPFAPDDATPSKGKKKNVINRATFSRTVTKVLSCASKGRTKKDESTASRKLKFFVVSHLHY